MASLLLTPLRECLILRSPRYWHDVVPSAASSNKLRTRRRRVLAPHGPQLHNQRHRSLLTEACEPPLDSTVPERPCTVILSEHAALYGSNSWHPTCQEVFPNQYGMPYRQFILGDDDNKEEDEKAAISAWTVDQALAQMKTELSQQTDGILIARGPWISWLAQFFLESLPLAGLVLVDPLPLDDADGIQQCQWIYRNQEHHHKQQSLELQRSLEYHLFQEFVNHWDHWSLKLEPGSVPMMVIRTFPRPAFGPLAQRTADRHSSDQLGAVPVVSILERDPEQQAQQAIATIAQWINDRVL